MALASASSGLPVDQAAPPSLEDLRHFASTSLARHKLPEALMVVAELPLTAMQKVDRRALERFVAPEPPTA